MITRRKLLYAAGATAGLGLGIGLYTWQVEPHWIQVVKRPLALKNLPDSLVGASLVQLSDLHIGPQVDDSYLNRVFARVSDAKPDVVLYTGDFVSRNADLATHVPRMMARLPLGRLATFGILGNHDYGPGWSHPEIAAQVAAFANERGVRILRNEVANVVGLQVIGLDDLWAGRCQLRTALMRHDPKHASIVLTHNPDTVDRTGWDSYTGWILAGHTHGGQIKPPFLPPPQLPVQNRRYTSGQFALRENRWLYINRGVGHLLQARFNARPEITWFTLVFA